MVMVSAGESRRMRRISLWAGVLLGVKYLEYEGGSAGEDGMMLLSKSERQVSAGERWGCCGCG